MNAASFIKESLPTAHYPLPTARYPLSIMKFADSIALALRNLRQARLRTSLTVIGVVVGVAAIVTMVSFGLGLQNNLLRDALARIDLLPRSP